METLIMQNEAKPMTAEELINANKGLQEMLDETAKRLQKERGWKTFWMFLAIVIVCICLYYKKSSILWLPVADSPQMCVVMSDWWSLKAQSVYPVWRKPTGVTEEYSEHWCIQYPDNTWRVFYGNDGKSSAYTYPLTNYSTYF
jgi:hypothetical protein